MVDSAAERVLLIQDRHLGDVVLTTALLQDLAAAFPAAALDFLAGRAAAPLLAHDPLIRDVLVLRRDDMRGVLRDVRARHYDIVIDVQASARTALVTRASGAPVRAGWDVRVRRFAYTHRVRRERETQYVVRDRQRLLHAIGIATKERLPRLHLTDDERAEGAVLLGGAEARRGRVGLLLTTREPPRNWPVTYFAELSRLVAAAGYAPVVLPGPGDEPRIAEFLGAGGVAHIAPLTGVRPLMAMLAHCALFISADTGPAHMATALGVPRVTLYGPSDPRAWDPGVANTRSLRAEPVPCDGCSRSVCVKDGACMAALRPEHVFTVAQELLGRVRS